MDEDDKQFIDQLFIKGEKMEPSYNKVQYSEFTPDRVGQWVLRGDTLDEVLAMKKELTDKLSVGKPIQTDDGTGPYYSYKPQTPVMAPVAPQGASAPTYTSAEDTAMCRTHNVKMKFYEKNGKTWWSHAKQDETGKWVYCSGKGFGVK